MVEPLGISEFPTEPWPQYTDGLRGSGDGRDYDTRDDLCGFVMLGITLLPVVDFSSFAEFGVGGALLPCCCCPAVAVTRG